MSRALSWAQSFIVGYCNQPFDLVTDDVVYLDPKPYRQALLPYVPVVSVSSVEGLLPPSSGANALAWTNLPNYRFVANTGLIYDTTGEPGTNWSYGPSWPWVAGGLRVTYTHGYSVVPQGLIDVGCRVAQQYLENPAITIHRRTGDMEARFSGSKGIVVSELDQRVLDRYTDIGIA